MAFTAPPPRFGARQLIGAARRALWLPALLLLAASAISLFIVFRPVGVYVAEGAVRLPRADRVAAEVSTLDGTDFVRQVVAHRGLRVFDTESQLPTTRVNVARVDAALDSMTFVRLRFDSTSYWARLGATEAVAPYGDTIYFPEVEFVVSSPPGLLTLGLAVVSEDAAVDFLESALKVTPGDAPGSITVQSASTSPTVAVHLTNAVLDEYAATRAQGLGSASGVVTTRPQEAHPLRLNTARYVLVVFAVAGLLGLVGMVARERLDTTLRRSGQMEYLLRVPRLVTIPPLPSDFAADSDRQDEATESFRSLRSFVLHKNGGPPLRCLVVTSPSLNDGTTTTAANLARSLADKGRRVLLIDCDMRRPELHELFKVKLTPGLSELLLDRVEMQAAFRKTATRNLYLLPAGTLPAQPTVLLTSKRFGAMLASLSMLFEVVIIDAPPMLAATDASLLAGMSDGVLLVVRAGSTETFAAMEAVRQLDVARANVVGAVFNDADGTAARYGG